MIFHTGTNRHCERKQLDQVQLFNNYYLIINNTRLQNLGVVWLPRSFTTFLMVFGALNPNLTSVFFSTSDFQDIASFKICLVLTFLHFLVKTHLAQISSKSTQTYRKFHVESEYVLSF